MEKFINDIKCEIQKKHINWGKIESLLAGNKQYINEYADEEDTILSLLIKYFNDGKKMLKLIELFFQYGYDVHANSDRNGSVCLHELCWSTYDQYILQAAELLLSRGANSHIPMYDEETDAEGVLESINWRLDDWSIGNPNTANIFEAYYLMIEREQAGKAYRGIRATSECVGKKLIKVERLLLKNRDKESGYKDNTALLCWFEESPLVISNYCDAIVNPYFEENVIEAIDVSDAYKEVIGVTLRGIRHTGANFLQINFHNDYRLLCCNDYQLCSDKIKMYEYLYKIEDVTLHPEDTIEKIAFHAGCTYAAMVRCYRQDDAFVLLEGKDVAIRIYNATKNSKRNKLKLEYVPREVCENAKVFIEDNDLRFRDRYIAEKTEVLRFSIGKEDLLIAADEGEDINVMLVERALNKDGEKVAKKIDCMQVSS